MRAPVSIQASQATHTAARVRALLLAVVLGVVLAAYIATLQAQAAHPQRSDFFKFYASARLLWEGRGIYDPVPTAPVAADAEIREEYLHANLNPPFQTVLLAPLGLLPYSSAFVIWGLLSLLSGSVASWLIGRQLGYRRPDQVLSWLLVLLLGYGTWLNAAAGQFGMVLLLTVALGWAWTLQGRDVLSGLVIGVALSVKVFVAALVLIWIIQRRWRALSWAVVTALACASIGGVGAGVGAYKDYLRVLGEVAWVADGRNASMIGMAERFCLARAEAGVSGLWAMVGQGAALAIVVVTAYWSWRARHSRCGSAAGMAAAVPAMLLASPLGWVYYFPALILPLAWLWKVARDTRLARARIALVVAWLLAVGPVVTEDSSPTWSALPFLGLFALWVGALAGVRRMALARIQTPCAFP